MSIKNICDSVARLDMFRGDTQNGLFAQQLVRATFRELFRFEYPETKWVNAGLIQLNTSLNEGATEYSFTEMGNTGRAEIVADGATDLPFADIEGRNNLRGIKTIGVAVRYSRQELRTARMNGLFDIASEKAGAAREAHDRTLDDLIRTGDAAAGLDGVVNQPGIIVANAITGNWAVASGVQIVADITTAINTIMNGSEAVEVPNTVLFDVASYTLISTTVHLPGASDRTILSFLREAFPMIQRWDWEPGMSTVSAVGAASMLVYRNDPMRIRAVVPMLMQAVPPEQRGLSFILNFETRFGGVMTPKPRSVLRLDGVNV
jgi:hypothetical protein